MIFGLGSRRLRVGDFFHSLMLCPFSLFRVFFGHNCDLSFISKSSMLGEPQAADFSSHIHIT